MNLKYIIDSYSIKEVIGNLDVGITGINHNSKMIKKGNIFVAIKGFNVDGHNYIEDAVENGAICIIYEDDLNILNGITYIKVKDTVDALAYICSNFFKKPWKELLMIGITGTNGKTSTSYFIKSILQANKIKSGVIGTTGGIIDEELINLDNTTPDSLVIQSTLRKISDTNNKACIMEVSSHALDLKRVEYMEFNIGIFTNLTKDHLDYHNTMDNYYKSKLKLFFKTTNYNIINIDDAYGLDILIDTDNRIPVLTYGIENKADVYATNILFSIDKVKFTLNYLNLKTNIEINVPGRFSVYNALAAAACGLALGIDIEIIKNGLEDLKGVKGRFEVVPINKDFTVIIDFAHTADGLEKVLTVIDQFAEGRKIVVFGAGGNRDKTKRPEMGETVGKHSDIAIITSDNPRFEDPLKIIEDIVVGIDKTKVEYKIIVNRKEAIEYAISQARAKDIILLAGKGHETYTIIGGETYPFDERKIVLDYLKDTYR